MTAYRNDIDALAAREVVLARELADKQRERDGIKRLLDEARVAEAVGLVEHDVMVGRRSLRRVAVGLALLLVAGVACGAAFVTYAEDGAASAVSPAVEQPDETRFGLALAIKGLTPVELEPRFIAGVAGLETPADVDLAIGGPVPAWEQFTYTRDAHARPAIASPPFRGGDVEPMPEFVSDGYGGVWLVIRTVPRAAVLAPANTGWSRKVFVLPLGSVFRGRVEILTRR